REVPRPGGETRPRPREGPSHRHTGSGDFREEEALRTLSRRPDRRRCLGKRWISAQAIRYLALITIHHEPNEIEKLGPIHVDRFLISVANSAPARRLSRPEVRSTDLAALPRRDRQPGAFRPPEPHQVEDLPSVIGGVR